MGTATIAARQTVSDEAPDFSGGLNLSADEANLQPNEMRRATNLRLTKFKAAKKRGGTRKLHATALQSGATIQGGFSWNEPTTAQQLAVANGVLHTGTYAVPMTWTAQTGTLSTTARISFASFISGSTTDVVYIADGGLLNKWDGATLTTNIASTPAVARLAVYNQRLYGVTGDNQTIYWSALNDGDSLGNAGAGGGSAIVRTFGDQKLTGLAAVGASLLMTHVSGISIFTGISQDDITIAAGARGLTSDVGTVFAGSIVNLDHTFTLLTDRGYIEANEQGLVPISDKIRPALDTFDRTDTDAPIGVHRAALHELWQYVTDEGMYCWNYDLRQWTGPWDGAFIDPVPTALWEAIDDQSRPIVLKGDEAGFVEQCDYPDTNLDHVLSDGTGGDAIVSALQPYRFWFGDPTMEVALRWLYLTANLQGSTLATCAWRMDTGASTYTLLSGNSPIWGAITWGSFVWGSGSVNTQRIPGAQRGYGLDVTLSDSGATESLWSKLRVEGFAMGRRGQT